VNIRFVFIGQQNIGLLWTYYFDFNSWHFELILQSVFICVLCSGCFWKYKIYCIFVT
jgi:hypothetical protein